jgi:hypothetical protein
MMEWRNCIASFLIFMGSCLRLIRLLSLRIVLFFIAAIADGFYGNTFARIRSAGRLILLGSRGTRAADSYWVFPSKRKVTSISIGSNETTPKKIQNMEVARAFGFLNWEHFWKLVS